MLLAAGIDDRAIPGVGRRALAGLRYAVGVLILHFVFAVRGEAAGNHLDSRLGFDADRAAAFISGAPQCDVEMMSAPIGHRAARVFPPVAKRHMAALLDVLDLRCLAEPQVPI